MKITVITHTKMSESWRKGTNTTLLSSLEADAEKMRMRKSHCGGQCSSFFQCLSDYL